MGKFGQNRQLRVFASDHPGGARPNNADRVAMQTGIKTQDRALNPRSRSSLRSVTSSRPTATLIRLSVIPAASRSSWLRRPWVVVAGCTIVVLASPRLAVSGAHPPGCSGGYRSFAARGHPRARSGCPNPGVGASPANPGPPLGRKKIPCMSWCLGANRHLGAHNAIARF